MPNIRQYINLFASRKIKILEKSLLYYVNKIEKQEYFSFSRYGDGEWSAILGQEGGNCDGHNYTEKLQQDLLRTINNQKKYYYGMQPFALKNLGSKIKKIIKKNSIQIEWQNASVFHDSNIEGELNPFVKVLRKNRVVIIGPSHLKKLQLFPIYHFIEIPLVNCFDYYDEILSSIKDIATKESNLIYLFSASMATNVLIDELFDDYGSSNYFLDVGALWDIYVGEKSRSVYEDRDWSERIKKNSAKD